MACAVGTNGELKDASDIIWYNSGDDEMPIPSTKGELRPDARASITAGPSSKSVSSVPDICGNIDPIIWEL